MAPRLGQRRKRGGSLAELPPSGNRDFWLGHVEIIRPTPEKECKHYFVRVRPNLVECKYCHAGLFVGPDVTIKKGHLYKEGKKIL